MISPHRLTACTAGLCALASLSLAFWLTPEGEGEPGAPPPSPLNPGAAGAPAAEGWLPPSEVYSQRLLPKGEVRRDLLAGRLSLLEAAMRFQELTEAGPPFDWDWYRDFCPGHTDLERFGRQLVATGDLYLSQVDPPGQAAVRTRLEAELQEYLAGQGPGDFPGR